MVHRRHLSIGRNLFSAVGSRQPTEIARVAAEIQPRKNAADASVVAYIQIQSPSNELEVL